MTKKQKYKGVTLVELVIAVVLSALLAVIAIPKMSKSAASARKYTCMANINMLNCAVEKYYLAHGTFPDNLNIIKQDKNYFPDGEPICPATGAGYPSQLTVANRVDAGRHDH